MKARRVNRINELIRMELGSLILTELRDPRLSQIVSITTVDVSADLGSAKIYVSIMGSSEDKRESLKGLWAASGFLRRELGRKVTLRSIPELRFLLDDSIEEGAKVVDLLREVALTTPCSADNEPSFPVEGSEEESEGWLERVQRNG